MKLIYKGDGFSGNKSIYTVKNFNNLVHPSNKTFAGFKKFYDGYDRKIFCVGKRIPLNGRSCDCYRPHYSKTRYYFHKDHLVAIMTWARVTYKESYYHENMDPQLQEANRKLNEELRNFGAYIGVELQQYEQGEKELYQLSADAQEVLQLLENKLKS